MQSFTKTPTAKFRKKSEAVYGTLIMTIIEDLCYNAASRSLSQVCDQPLSGVKTISNSILQIEKVILRIINIKITVQISIVRSGKIIDESYLPDFIERPISKLKLPK